jgi:hypothetical protein
MTVGQKNIGSLPVRDGVAGDGLESGAELADTEVTVALYAGDGFVEWVQEADHCPGIKVVFLLIGAGIGDIPQEDEFLAFFLVVEF